MIPEIDKLEKYKSYLLILVLLGAGIVAVVSFYEYSFHTITIQTLIFRIGGYGTSVIMYFIAKKGIDLAESYLLKTNGAHK